MVTSSAILQRNHKNNNYLTSLLYYFKQKQKSYLLYLNNYKMLKEKETKQLKFCNLNRLKLIYYEFL